MRKKHVCEWLGWPENAAPLSCVWYLAASTRQPCWGLALAPYLQVSAPDLYGLPARGADLLPTCTPHLACSGDGHSLGAVRNHSLKLQRCLLQPTLVIHKYNFTLRTKSPISHKPKPAQGGTGFASCATSAGEYSNFFGTLLSSKNLLSSSLNLQKRLGRYESNASLYWDLTLLMPRVSRKACFHSPCLK